MYLLYGLTIGASFSVMVTGDWVYGTLLFALGTAGLAIREGFQV